MRLAVLADTQHHLDEQGQARARGAVAAQLDRWAALFDTVVICAPLHDGSPPPEFEPYRAANVQLRPVRPAGGSSMPAKLLVAARALSWWRAIRSVLPQVDAVHVRCPCNVALVALAATWRAPVRRYAMYAGNWYGYRSEPWSYRLQRWLLRRPSFPGLVTVYAGSDERHPAHVVPLFSPAGTDAEWNREAPTVSTKLAQLQGDTAPRPLRLVAVGHLTANKNHRVVLEALAMLRRLGLDAELDVAGDGEAMPLLRRLRSGLGLETYVRLHGACSREDVKALYRSAHLNVVASRTEGFPKVAVEGMTAGAVPVLSDFPMARAIVGDGERGLVFSGEAASFSQAVAALASDGPRLAAMIAAGRAYARERTLEAFEQAIRSLLQEHWHLGVDERGTLREVAEKR